MILLFMLPVFGANLLQALYGTVDLMVVGQFASTADVSAVSTGSMTMQTITGLTMGCTVRIGHLIGQKNKEEAARTVGTALSLFLGIGLLLAVLIGILIGPLAAVMNAPEDAFSATVSYIRRCRRRRENLRADVPDPGCRDGRCFHLLRAERRCRRIQACPLIHVSRHDLDIRSGTCRFSVQLLPRCASCPSLLG